MIQEWVGVAVMVLPLGLVLGYWSALPRVKRLEQELAAQSQLKSHSEWVVELGLAKATALVLQSELEKVQVRVQDSELELVRAKQKAQLRESELEMALDLARSKEMGLA